MAIKLLQQAYIYLLLKCYIISLNNNTNKSKLLLQGGILMGENNNSAACTVCKFCNNTENEKPIFTTRYKGEELCVCARCLPGLIHG
jgi:hypothetical protein